MFKSQGRRMDTVRVVEDNVNSPGMVDPKLSGSRRDENKWVKSTGTYQEETTTCFVKLNTESGL